MNVWIKIIYIHTQQGQSYQSQKSFHSYLHKCVCVCLWSEKYFQFIKIHVYYSTWISDLFKELQETQTNIIWFQLLSMKKYLIWKSDFAHKLIWNHVLLYQIYAIYTSFTISLFPKISLESTCLAIWEHRTGRISK